MSKLNMVTKYGQKTKQFLICYWIICLIILLIFPNSTQGSKKVYLWRLVKSPAVNNLRYDIISDILLALSMRLVITINITVFAKNNLSVKWEASTFALSLIC